MSFARFEQLLEQTTGLSAASLGASTIEGAVRARLRACELEDADNYWERILRSPDEVQQLVEAIVVPETWFFRDPQAFVAAARFAVKEWLSAPADGVFRLLSLPCSTGEEPYTMAMALIEAGLPIDRFRIDAIDISRPALAIAQRGIYGGNSFRDRDLAFRKRHFERAEGGWRISETVRSTVRFVPGNLLDADFENGSETYDIVFCRNLLIYFGVDTQKRAVSVLKRLLSPQGMLFVGHSETGLMHGRGFAPAKIPLAFAFRHAAMPDQPKAKVIAPGSAFQPMAAIGKNSPPALWSASPSKREAASSDLGPDLDELHRIADRGQLAEAARGCEHYIRERGVSPDALLLLGLIKDASGDASAAAGYYRKLLYLEPDHEEALGHLALLLKKQGNASGAKILDDRMRRLDARGAR